jgi:hypothetical protein
MVGGRSFAGLAAFVLTAVAVISIALWFAPPSPERVKPRNRGELPDSWSLLCDRTDCSRFPVGYKTAKVGDSYFYFSTGGADPERLLLPTMYRFFDVSDDGKLVRSVELDPFRQSVTVTDFCCPNLHGRHGISPPMKSGYHRARRASYYAPGYQPTWKRLFTKEPLGQLNDLKAFESPAHLAQAGLRSFDDNFWLVRSGKHHSAAKRRIMLISKRPVLFGRHAWVNCGHRCYAATVTFTKEPQPDLPHVFVDEISDETLDGGITCHNAGPCLASNSPYEVLPDTLLWVENVLLAMQRRPSELSPP